MRLSCMSIWPNYKISVLNNEVERNLRGQFPIDKQKEFKCVRINQVRILLLWDRASNITQLA